MRRLIISIFILVFAGITAIQFRENLSLRREPPSSKWAKEVLISSGNITDYPQLIKDSDKYIVAHTDGNKIKIMAVDNLGKKLKEKSFEAEGDMPINVHVVTNGKSLKVSWISSNKVKIMHSLLLDSDFNIIGKESENDIIDLKQVGSNLLVLAFNDRIKLEDYKSGKSSEVIAPQNSMLCGTKSGNKYIVAFLNNDNNFCYFAVKDGIASEPREVGIIRGNSRVNYYNSAVTIKGDKGYIFAEYRYQSMYGVSKIMEFALDGSSYKTRETSDSEKALSLFNIVSYTEGNDSGTNFMAGGYIPLGKKESYEDILDLEIKDGIVARSIPASRTRALSGYPSGFGDTVIFADVVGIDYSNLYMTSYREDFKNANNINRDNEIVLALLDTIQSILYVFVYLVAYGVLWIIPAFCTTSLISLIEYKFTNKNRKLIFIAAYFISVLFKSYFVYNTMFKRFKFFLPQYMTPTVGITAELAISIVCCIYGYRKYIVNMEKNVIPISFSPAFLLDSWLTLFLFVPFMK